MSWHPADWYYDDSIKIFGLILSKLQMPRDSRYDNDADLVNFAH